MADSAWFLPVMGALVGIVMGATARRHHFCTMAALERHWYAGDSRGLRTWVLAAALAIIVTQAMTLSGTIDLSDSFYLTDRFGLTGAVVGGLAFGFGMALVGTCGFGALVRLGGGSLRSLVVLIALGLSALAAQRGVFAQARVYLVDNLAIDLGFAGDQSLGSLVSAMLGLDVRAPLAIAVVAALIAWVFADKSYRRRYGSIAAGTVIGCAVAVGWLITHMAAQTSFEPVQLEAASFVVPVGDTIVQLIALTGVLPDYGVGLVLGVVAGSAAMAWSKRDIRWEACDDARELSRHLLGAFLMGTGGVFALGCTIGQGVSAASVLALSSPVTMLSIAVGARLGLAYLLDGSFASSLRKPRTGMS
jgi:uncharacterized membrane protein YedE/YeeE